MAYEGSQYSGNRIPKGTLIFYAVLLLIPLFIVGTAAILNELHFKQNCLGHLARASQANTIETAAEELETAVTYLSKNQITEGYTTIFSSFQTPDEDIGFWYKNLSDSLDQLKKIPKTASPLERSNVLLKLRETLSHHPEGIERFPNNGTWSLATIATGILGVLGIGLIFYATIP